MKKFGDYIILRKFVITMRKLSAIKRIAQLAMVVLAAAVASQAHAVGYYFKQLSIADGLSQSSVQCIHRDTKGFLWVGTKYGLNRFDNENITTFYAGMPGTATSITANEIKFITEDARGTIWVGAINGISTYDSRQGTFTEVLCDGSRVNVRSYCATPDGLLLGGAGNIYHYSYAEQRLSRIEVSGGSTMFYTYIGQMADGRFLLATRWDGMWIYNPKTATVERMAAMGEKKIMATCIDKHGNIYISPYGAGIYCYSPNLKLSYHAGTHNQMLSSNLVTDMEECDGTLWIGTDGGGINLLDIASRRVQNLGSTAGITSALPVSSVLCLYRDTDDNMWAGTVRGGVMYIHSVYMHTHSNMLKNDNRWISARTVLSIAPESNGHILVGIDDGGVCDFDPTTGEFKEYRTTFGMKVSSLAEIDAEKVLISEYASGLHILNKASGRLTRITYLDPASDRLLRTRPVALNISTIDRERVLLVSDSLCIYHHKARRFERLAQPGGKSQGSLNCFYCDSTRALLFRGNEIFELNIPQKTCRLVGATGAGQSITCAQHDGKSRIYIGTINGLVHCDIATGHCQPLNSDMLRCITAMTLDGNCLWIGAQNSLLLRLIDSGNTLILGPADGVATNEFIYKAVLNAPSGIYMGGNSGLLHIDNNAAHEILNSNSAIEISLTDVLIDGISHSGDIDGQRIAVPYDHSSVTIRLIDREKNTFRRKMFRYSIDGAKRDNNTIETDERSLTLNMLQSGSYKVWVSCSTQDGGWTRPVMLVELDVLTPWWRTGYAFAAYGIVVALLWFMVTRYLYRKKKDQMQLIMKEHERMSYEKQVNFLVNINHELRTPLTLIYAPLKRLLKRLHNADAAMVECELKGIYRQTKKMRNIINMILDLRRLESGHTELRFTATDINAWVRGVTDDFASELEAKQLTVVTRLDEGIGQVSIDVDKCDLVLSNIIINALKYTRPGTTLTITTERRGGMVRVSVIDCGPGLKGVDPSQLFTVFYQGDNAVAGTGLGLAYSKSLITLQNGNIGAEDNAGGEGATFWFELPLDRKEGETQKVRIENTLLDDTTAAVPARDAAADDFDMSELKAIVIEDDTDLNNFIVEGLRPAFGQVLHAFNGKEALMQIKQMKPDIIISDVMVPLMNGFELCRAVKQSEELQHIPVILLTARINDDSIEQGYNQGADSYMSKPFSLDMLIARCRNLLHNRTIVRRRYKGSGTVTIPEEAKMNNSNESFLLQINKVIAENIGNPDFSVDSIVEKMLMSRASVYNRLKELTGYSIGDYINEYRFTHAKELLTGSNLPINEIAAQLGFNSQRYFSTFFKNKTGMTPSAYRNDARKEG